MNFEVLRRQMRPREERRHPLTGRRPGLSRRRLAEPEESRNVQGQLSGRGAVLVTGASGGIGQATTRHLAALGFAVFAGVRRVESAEQLHADLTPGVRPLVLDVTDAAAIRAARDALAAAVGEFGLVGLVNNAGVTVPGPLEFLPLDLFREQWEVNVTGPLLVTQAMVPLLRLRQGRVVNIGSFSGQVALPFYGAYAASKFALDALTDALRLELRPSGIRVVLVEPGSVRTAIWDRALATGEAWLRSAPPDALARYGRAMAGVRVNARRLERAAFGAEVVARSVGRALTERRPRARYRVAYPVLLRLLLVLDCFPTWFRDAVIAGTLPRYP
jgi:NAD(P)-dependent dehydrogenase (short-subunit alcohol dehydrogenase family)